MQLLLGLTFGCIFILLALGLSIIFGLLGIVNFAHGVFCMLGAYAAFLGLGLTGNFWMALILAPLVVGGLGFLAELGVLRPIYRSKNPVFAGVLTTYGLSLIFPDIIRMFFGRSGKPFRIPAILDATYHYALMSFSAYRFFIIGITAAILPLVWLLLYRTNIGMIIRAGTTDNLMVQLLGIKVQRVWTFTFALGIALAALAGILIAPIRGIFPEMGGLVLIESFIVVIVGGMGSFKGAIIGGLIIGEAVSLTNLMYGPMANVIIYIVMAFILLARPRGLFGEEGVSER